ncbi:MAG: OB-fold domain-containing protein [Syntrophaceae bacterium]|nr:OB-fold domain-containing protein [Syntrophaceae bacterium]
MTKKQVPFNVNYLTEPLFPLENVCLKGSKCKACGVVSFGKRLHCEQCTSKELEDVVLGTQGKIYSYTVIRHPAPPPYIPPEPFVPFPAAWVELPEGVRVLSPLTECELDQVKIGMDVELVIREAWEDEQGNSVIAFAFKPVK